MPELLDLLTPAGEPTGHTKPKADVHRDGDWHRSAHVWLLNDRGELLLQLRSPHKENDPDRWDISVAGHVSAGEDARTSACREVAEEIGLEIGADELQWLFHLPVERSLNGGTYLDREWHEVFLLRKDPALADLTLQLSEVAAVRWERIEAFGQRVTARDANLVPHWEEYERLLTWLAV
jgi:isopentenyl-diphosphate Delta-isomerase